MAKFKKGDRVRMTPLALDRKLDGPRHRMVGVVMGMTRDGYVRVKRDGDRASRQYYTGFWGHDGSEIHELMAFAREMEAL